MTGHKVNTLLSLPSLVTVNCRATNQTVGKPRHRSFFATEKAPNVIPEAFIPFLPTVSDKPAYLIEPSSVPGFCDEFGSRKLRVRFNVPQHRRIRHQLS